MVIRSIDFVGNPGGGIRFTVELLNAMANLRPSFTFELYTSGAAYSRYRNALSGAARNIKIENTSPENNWRNKRPFPKFSFPGRELLRRMLSTITKWHYDMPKALGRGCDILWFPWIHSHHVPTGMNCGIVGSFHDAIIFNFDIGLYNERVNAERRTIKGWINSPSKIIVSSNTTQKNLEGLFSINRERLNVIPLSGEHLLVPTISEVPQSWDLQKKKYLIYPANITPHKNHEFLFKALALYKGNLSVVLTGEGSDLNSSERGKRLRIQAEEQGLLSKNKLITLGFVPSPIFNALLRDASGLVMCSLAEGGGSFPVWEAMLKGIPVLCSDIPVMREQIRRTGGSVLWFNPEAPADLARKIHYFEDNYDAIKRIAENERDNLTIRSWEDVAREYIELFEELIAKAKKNETLNPISAT